MGRERSVLLARLEWVLLAVLVAGLGFGLRFLHVRETLERATDWIDSLGWWAPAAFVALYVLCTLLLIPRSVLTVAAGFLFGFGWGGLWALLAVNLGANLAFLAGKHYARAAVERHTRDHGRLDALDRAVARGGWKIVALTRLSPVFPYSLLNYAFGLTRVSWRRFFFGSALGLLPGTLLLVGLGSLTDFAAERGGESPGVFMSLAIAAAAVVALGATLLVTRFARRVLRRSAGPGLS